MNINWVLKIAIILLTELVVQNTIVANSFVDNERLFDTDIEKIFFCHGGLDIFLDDYFIENSYDRQYYEDYFKFRKEFILYAYSNHNIKSIAYETSKGFDYIVNEYFETHNEKYLKYFYSYKPYYDFIKDEIDLIDSLNLNIYSIGRSRGVMQTTTKGIVLDLLSSNDSSIRFINTIKEVSRETTYSKHNIDAYISRIENYELLKTKDIIMSILSLYNNNNKKKNYDYFSTLYLNDDIEKFLQDDSILFNQIIYEMLQFYKPQRGTPSQITAARNALLVEVSTYSAKKYAGNTLYMVSNKRMLESNEEYQLIDEFIRREPGLKYGVVYLIDNEKKSDLEEAIIYTEKINIKLFNNVYDFRKIYCNTPCSLFKIYNNSKYYVYNPLE